MIWLEIYGIGILVNFIVGMIGAIWRKDDPEKSEMWAGLIFLSPVWPVALIALPARIKDGDL